MFLLSLIRLLELKSSNETQTKIISDLAGENDRLQLEISNLNPENCNVLRDTNTGKVIKSQKVIVHAGDIIDGISVDGELFGNNGGSSTGLYFQNDETVTALEFGYHTHRTGK